MVFVEEVLEVPNEHWGCVAQMMVSFNQYLVMDDSPNLLMQRYFNVLLLFVLFLSNGLEVVLLDESAEGTFDFEAEVVRNLVLVCKIEQADRPLFLTVEDVHKLLLELLH